MPPVPAETTFFAPSVERFKGLTHGVTGALLFALGLYNYGAYLLRRERRLGRHALLYTAGAIYEGVQLWRHLR